MLCECKCGRTRMGKIHFDIYKKGKHCEDCGKKFKLIESPVIGVRVKVEGGDFEDGQWVTLEELKELLKD